jgi:hypothetical protein
MVAQGLHDLLLVVVEMNSHAQLPQHAGKVIKCADAGKYLR